MKDTFSELEREMLKCTYRELVDTKRDSLTTGQLIEKYGLSSREGWVAKAMTRLATDGYIKDNYGAAGPELHQVIGLTGLGLKRAEEIHEEDRKKTWEEMVKSVPRSDWIAIVALIISLIAFLKPGN